MKVPQEMIDDARKGYGRNLITTEQTYPCLGSRRIVDCSKVMEWSKERDKEVYRKLVPWMTKFEDERLDELVARGRNRKEKRSLRRHNKEGKLLKVTEILQEKRRLTVEYEEEHARPGYKLGDLEPGLVCGFFPADEVVAGSLAFLSWLTEEVTSLPLARSIFCDDQYKPIGVFKIEKKEGLCVVVEGVKYRLR